MTSFNNVILGIGIGDAAAAGREFAHDTSAEYQDGKLEYVSHPNTEFNHEAGKYTDDCQMSMAVSELMLSNTPFAHLPLADSFVNAYKRDPTAGYAGRFQQFLDDIGSGIEFLEKIIPTSTKNGAAMRAIPIGAYKNIKDVETNARINAHLTHNTPKGVASSVAVATMSHLLYHYPNTPNIFDETAKRIGKIDSESADFLYEAAAMKELDPKFLFGEEWENKGVPCDAMRTVGAVAYILNNYGDASSIISESIKLGGDTDSVASIALGLHMINAPLSEIPKHLVDGLYNRKYGKDYLMTLGSRLENKFGK